MKRSRMIIACLIVAISGYLASDATTHAQEKDSYTLGEKVAVDSTLIDQILIHDAQTSARFDLQETEIRNIDSRMSHMEGGFAGVVCLMGLYFGLPFVPVKWKRRIP